MENTMNAITITIEDLKNAADTKCMEVSENIKASFHLEDALSKEIIDLSMTFIEALTAMIIANF